MKSILKVRRYGDPCLRQRCAPVAEVGPAERMLIEAMLDTMYEYKGVGLAAPQVGINQQIFVADVGMGPFAVINPQIVKRQGTDKMEEGCLCLPGLVVDVKRAKEIRVRYRDENNQPFERDLTNMMAKVFQHETDHLNGKLIIDYAGPRTRAKLEKQWERLCLERGEG